MIRFMLIAILLVLSLFSLAWTEKRPPENPCGPFVVKTCDPSPDHGTVANLGVQSTDGPGVITLCQPFMITLDITFPANFPLNLSSAIYDVSLDVQQVSVKKLRKTYCLNGDYINIHDQVEPGKCSWAVCPEVCLFGLDCDSFCNTTLFIEYIGKTSHIVHKMITYPARPQATELVTGCYSGKVVFYEDGTKTNELGCATFTDLYAKVTPSACQTV